MKSGMKQRMVGAAVLVAIGIIVWTIVFDPSQVGRFSQRSEIPPAPDFERYQVPAAQRPEGLKTIDYPRETVPADPAAGDDSVAEDASVAQTAPVEPPTDTDEFGLPVLWAVQVGSFGKVENAQGLKQQLEQGGYHVIVQTVEADGERMTRLFVDPKMDKRSAERMRAEVDSRFGTSSLVVRYYPG